MKHLFTPARLVAGSALATVALGSLTGAEPPTATPVRVSPAEARRMVRMMNDIYISAVLTTHRMYVHDAGTPAAVTWAKQVSRQVAGRGWPAAHIFSGSERSLNPENAPQDPFEKEALEAFKRGKLAYEKIEPGALRYATPISVVDKSCLMCHVHNQEGDLLGGVSYRVLLSQERKTASR